MLKVIIFADAFSTKFADSLKRQHWKVSYVRKCWITIPLGVSSLYWVLACRTVEKQNNNKILRYRKISFNFQMHLKKYIRKYPLAYFIYYERKTGEGNHDSSKELRNVLLASINDMEETECFLASYSLLFYI